MSIQNSVDISLDASGLEDVRLEVSKASKDVALTTSTAVGGISYDYNQLANKPKINGNTLVGDKDFEDLGLGQVTEQEIDNMIFGGG